ncbi:MAG TPA: gamma-glutamyl-gamma-aminobutyrate hydrolase family protein [Gemmatimonadaceae bacterium]|nr:gamma-glutamyl-gamma-aminobutyrate hydrolase family protein [Gemmatimonadaceae bacterium]
MSRPLIGITTQSLQAIDGIPETLPPSVVMNQQYHLAVAAAGGAPVLVPLIAADEDALRAIYERLDGVLLPGGVDIEPSAYGETPHAKLGRVDPARDTTELTLARWALADDKPLLGVCRGIQVMNVACHGALHQDIASEMPDAGKHDWFAETGKGRDFIAHTVRTEAGSKLHEMLGDECEVNSLHHQAINALGTGLRVTAVAPDGVIEGIECDAATFAVGVQWHPEVFATRDAKSLGLFQALVSAAARARVP